MVITALFWVRSTCMATLSYLDWTQLLLAFIFSTASDCGIGEWSWARICFRPIHWSTVVVARSFCKSIDVYGQDIHLRNLCTLWYPSSLSFIQSSLYCNGDSSVLAVADGSQLSIWDLRTNHNGGCIQRVCGSIGDLIYSVCSSLSGTIAVVGTDRNVRVYDPRRWSAMSRWVTCSEYEITGLSFSSIDSAYIYVQGVDYETSETPYDVPFVGLKGSRLPASCPMARGQVGSSHVRNGRRPG